mgnify:CR=1 FL=1
MAMSGGIDSTMASLILHESGYEVIGLTMKTWDYESSGGNKKETGCCSLDSINDARQLAVDCGFPHTILDIREEFGDSIIDNFVDEYIAGRTPNPCVLCNTYIKWEALLKRADMLNCKYIATGHYAQIREENGRYVVFKGLDESKDQSYVLWGVSQECLKRTIFPMGKYHKKDIKKMALDRGYKELAEKNESYEICFIPDNDYRSFLKRRVKGLQEKVQGGKFIKSDGLFNNLGMAIKIALDLGIKKKLIEKTIPIIKFEGRLDYLNKGKLNKKLHKNEKLLVDGCHSQISGKNLSNYLRKLNIPKYGVWSFMKQKEPDLFIKEFKGVFKKIITLPINGQKKCESPKKLKIIAKKYGFVTLSASSIEKALKMISNEEKKIICFFGSLYQAGNILNKN